MSRAPATTSRLLRPSRGAAPTIAEATASRRPCAARASARPSPPPSSSEAAVHGLPFTDEGHTALCARSWLAPWRAGSPSPRSAAPRAVAVVGAGGSGKTAVIARLAVAYAAARRLPVAVIALRSKDSGAELARLLAPAGVPMWATDDVEGAAARIANLRRGALVLVDTPALPAQMQAPIPSSPTPSPPTCAASASTRSTSPFPPTLAGEVAREMLVASRDRRRRPHRRDPQRRHRPPGHARRAGRRGEPADLLPGRQRHGAPRRRRGPGLRPAAMTRAMLDRPTVSFELPSR